jgi:hypothetical protein
MCGLFALSIASQFATQPVRVDEAFVAQLAVEGAAFWVAGTSTT